MNGTCHEVPIICDPPCGLVQSKQRMSRGSVRWTDELRTRLRGHCLLAFGSKGQGNLVFYFSCGIIELYFNNRGIQCLTSLISLKYPARYLSKMS